MWQFNRPLPLARELRLGTLMFLLPLISTAFPQAPADTQLEVSETQVGYQADGRMLTPVNQIVSPYGDQLDVPGMRPQALALSHHGKLLAVSGKTNNLLIVDPIQRTVRQTVSMPGPATETTSPWIDSAQVSYTGLIFSPDDRQIYLSDVNGSIKVFAVDDGRHGHAGPFDSAAARQRTSPSGRNSQRFGDLQRWHNAIRLWESLQPAAGS